MNPISDFINEIKLKKVHAANEDGDPMETIVFEKDTVESFREPESRTLASFTLVNPTTHVVFFRMLKSVALNLNYMSPIYGYIFPKSYCLIKSNNL